MKQSFDILHFDYVPLTGQATTENPKGVIACKLERRYFIPETRVDINGGEKTYMAKKVFSVAQMLCAMCVRYEDCRDNDLPSNTAYVTAGVQAWSKNTTHGRAKATKEEAQMEIMRKEYLASLGT